MLSYVVLLVAADGLLNLTYITGGKKYRFVAIWC
jgi:hypothetical protein